MAIPISEREERRHEGRAALAARVSREGSPMGEEPGDPAAGAGSLATVSAREVALPPTPSSMALPVTRHAQNPFLTEFSYLLCGVDTLDLGLYVSWNGKLREAIDVLEEQKTLAQTSDKLLSCTDLGRDYLVYPGGKNQIYRYHLQFQEYHLFISKSEQLDATPNVYVSFDAAVLWHVELSTLLELLTFDLEQFHGTIERIQPSRVDLCADFRLATAPTVPFLEEHRVSRSRKVKFFIDNGVLETYYCGSASAPAQVRIYDKAKEIRKSHKQWFFPLWKVGEDTPVWRTEFQLRRTFLHHYRVNTLDDLWAKIGTMWDYLTARWFSLRLPDDPKAERRTIHPWWQAVQGCGPRFGDNCGARRDFSSDSQEPIERSLAHIKGRCITIAAQSGIRDRKEAISLLCTLLDRAMDDHHFALEYRKRLLRLGYRGSLGGDDDDQ